MPTVHVTRRALCALISLGLAAAVPAAMAAKPKSSVKAKGAAKSDAKGKSTGKPKFEKGAGETMPERERRLYRECKGRPNSGACMGFAS